MGVKCMRRQGFRGGDRNMLVHRSTACLAYEILGPGVPLELVIVIVAVRVVGVDVGDCMRIFCR